ncbi:hypothetical protein WMY93_031043 [Mugilogobius chulae]|uniref:Cystatin domain-containing protein n=1 Tax=Mugilogobius chulae TaxID=88201 RepID=A0AAW0MIX9_9GOBI
MQVKKLRLFRVKFNFNKPQTTTTQRSGRGQEAETGSEEMAPLLTLSAAFLVLCVPLACGGRCVPGGPCDVSTDDHRVQQVALFAAESFNNQSDDSFLFRPQRVVKAQRQVVKGVRFLLDLDLCRTVCLVLSLVLVFVLILTLVLTLVLGLVLRCHAEVWDVVWTNQSVVQRLVCKSRVYLNDS